MIKNYRDKETEKIADGFASRKLPRQIQVRAKMRLERLHAAIELDDLLAPPSHRLEALSGKRKGQYSIRVNDQWRICFRWDNTHAHDVEIVDYH